MTHARILEAERGDVNAERGWDVDGDALILAILSHGGLFQATTMSAERFESIFKVSLERLSPNRLGGEELFVRILQGKNLPVPP